MQKLIAWKRLYLDAETVSEVCRLLFMAVAGALIAFLISLSPYHATAQDTIPERMKAAEKSISALEKIDDINDQAIRELRAIGLENAKNISRIQGGGTMLVSVLVLIQVFQAIVGKKKNGQRPS